MFKLRVELKPFRNGRPTLNPFKAITLISDRKNDIEKKDAEIRRLLLTEVVKKLLTGDIEAGKAVLRDYIKVKGVSVGSGLFS